MASLAKPESPPVQAEPVQAEPAPTEENTIKLLKKNYQKIQRVLNNKDNKDPKDGKIYHYVEGPRKRDGSRRLYNLNNGMEVSALQQIMALLPPRARSPDEEEAYVQGIYGRGKQRRRKSRRRRKKSRSSVRRRPLEPSSYMKRLRKKRKNKSSRKKYKGGRRKKTRKYKKRSGSRRGTKKMMGGSMGYSFNGDIKNMALATPMPRTRYDTCPANDL